MDGRIEPLSDTPLAEPLGGLRVRRRWLLQAAWRLLDLGLIYAGFALAHWLRYDIRLGRDIYDPLAYKELAAFQPVVIGLMLALLAVFHIKGLYRLPRSAQWFDHAGIIVDSVTIGLALVVISIFALQKFMWSRLLFVFVWATVIALLVASRILQRMWVRWAWRRGRWLDRVLVVGNRGLAKQVMTELANSPQHGALLVGYIDGPPDDRDMLQPDERFRWLGAFEDLRDTLARMPIDQVIIALPFWAHDRLPEVVGICRQRDLEFRVAPDLYELSFDRVNIQQLSSIPLLALKKNIIRGWNYLLKRALDLALIGLTAPVWAPVWLAAAALIKLSAPGAPTMFSQPRVGRGGKQFMVYKLRTMVPNAEELKETLREQNEVSGPLFKIRRDPRVTRVGRVLRKLSVDELPQLINVLRGEMSLVGPRPQVPDEVAQYEPWHYRRLEVPPGLTGLWQATGRSNTSFDDMVRLDIYYTEHWSLWLDIRIMLLTVPAVLFGRGAY